MPILYPTAESKESIGKKNEKRTPYLSRCTFPIIFVSNICLFICLFYSILFILGISIQSSIYFINNAMYVFLFGFSPFCKTKTTNNNNMKRHSYYKGNPLGIIGMFGLFSAGMWTYGSFFPSIHTFIPFFTFWQYLSYLGRALSIPVEVWLSFSYFRMVADLDEK